MKHLSIFILCLSSVACEQILGIKDTVVVSSEDAATSSDAAPPPFDSAPLEPVPSDEPPQELILINLVNAATSEPLNSPVNILIQGTGREVVIDELGMRRTEFSDVYKTLRFGLATSATFPVSLVLKISGPGFLSTTYPVVIYQRADLISELRVVSLENLPSGIYVTRDMSGVADVNGELMMPVSLETRGDSGEVTASVTVPQGIVMFDRDGSPLAGALTVEMAHYESGDFESLAAFPGGMEVSTNEGDGLFSTAGLLSLEITDASGRSAATFENDVISATMTVASGIMNPDTNAEIAGGDSVGLWSHNAETGAWTREGDVTLTGKEEALTAQFSINHLSLWNLDFKINKCDMSREIEVRNAGTLTLVPPAIAQHFVYFLAYTNFDGTRPSFSRQFRPGDFFDAEPSGPANVLQFRNAPNEDSGRFTLAAYWKVVHPECLLGSKDFNKIDGLPLCALASEGLPVNPDPNQPGLEKCPAP